MGCDIHLFKEKFSNEPEYGRLDKAEQRDLNLEIINGKTFDYRWISADVWELDSYGEKGEGSYEEWWDIERCDYGRRNYQLFNILSGGVRGDENDPIIISAPKGIDENSSDPYLKEVKHWAGDGHSHSYLTLKEIKEHLPKIKKVESYTLESYKSLINDLEKINERNDGNPEHVRICFFFDN